MGDKMVVDHKKGLKNASGTNGIVITPVASGQYTLQAKDGFEGAAILIPGPPPSGKGGLVTLTPQYSALLGGEKCGGGSVGPAASPFSYSFAFPPTEGLGKTTPATGALTLTLKVLLDDGSRVAFSATSQ
jgi:hypothetical protein